MRSLCVKMSFTFFVFDFRVFSLHFYFLRRFIVDCAGGRAQQIFDLQINQRKNNLQNNVSSYVTPFVIRLRMLHLFIVLFICFFFLLNLIF